MVEDASAPPFYTDLYNFRDSSQDDIFEDSYPNGIPHPSPEQTVVPTPVFPSTSTSASASVSQPAATATSSTSSFPQPSRRAISRPKKNDRDVAKQLYRKMKSSRYVQFSRERMILSNSESLLTRSDVDVKGHLLRARRTQPWTPDSN